VRLVLEGGLWAAYSANSSSSALAPFKSAVSKPAVSSTSMSNACSELTPAPGSVAPSLPTVPNIARRKIAGRDAARNLPENVAGHAMPEKLSSYGEGEGDGGIEMSPAYRAHELGDDHDDHAGRHHCHAQGDFAAAFCCHYVRAGGHHD
jgi:hypothetical protein